MQSTAEPTTHSGDAAAVGSRRAASSLDTFRALCSQVECYGQGNVHTDIMKSLKISVCEKPGIPLVLFVYKVSHETVDLRNALQWIEENRGRKREDICAVILLEKSSDTDKKAVEVAHPGMFDEKTAVVRILWQTTLFGSSVKIPKDVSTKIKQSILGWQSEYRFQGTAGLPTQREGRERGKSRKEWREIDREGRERDRESDREGRESDREKRKDREESRVECYGQGNVHTDIMKLLNFSACAKPGIPLVLFVYKVSRETVDLRNALQWIEENRGRKREDICAVILLEKSSDTDKKPVEVAHPGMFDEKTAVVRIRWKHQNFHRSSVEIPMDDSTKSAIKIIKRSILGWEGSPAGGDVRYPDPPPCGESASHTQAQCCCYFPLQPPLLRTDR